MHAGGVPEGARCRPTASEAEKKKKKQQNDRREEQQKLSERPWPVQSSRGRSGHCCACYVWGNAGTARTNSAHLTLMAASVRPFR